MFHPVFESHDGRVLGAVSEEKHEPASDIDTVVVDSLKALDLKWPIREADIRARSGRLKHSRRPVLDGPYLLRPRYLFGMPKFKVEFSNNSTTVPERELDFPDVEAACKGAKEIADQMRADGILTFGFSDWQMTIMNADGETVAEYPLEEHEDT